MKVVIVDADMLGRKKQRFPNLACMKLSAFYKKLGNDVSLAAAWEDVLDADAAHVSKVFTETPAPDFVLDRKNVYLGGTGFNFYAPAPLPDEIEHIMPDYDLYTPFIGDGYDWKYHRDFSIGYTTRGCFRHCSNCVNRDSMMSVRHSPVSEFLNPARKHICLLDDNVLACKDWREIFAELNATGKKFQYKQGLDVRLLTDEKCKVIFGSNWIGDYIFAFDDIDDRVEIEEKIKLLRHHTDVVPKFYVFCGYKSVDAADIADLFERIRILGSYRCLPYVMRHENYRESPYKGMYDTIARWCNQPSFVKKKTFHEFVYETAGQNKSAPRYAEAFAYWHPDIADKYYHMRWG